jgi:hypothetical protein
MNVPTTRYVDADLADFGRGPLTSRRCWLAVPVDAAPHVRCAGCRQRFETLTEFEGHLREGELVQAAIAEIEADDRRHRRERAEATA